MRRYDDRAQEEDGSRSLAQAIAMPDSGAPYAVSQN